MLELSQILANLGLVILALAAVIGGGFAVWQHRRSVRASETELLFKLYQSFYETDRYRHVRHTIDDILDPDNSAAPEALLVGAKPARANEEAFVDYLNFFEFIFGLVKTKRLRRTDVDAAFEYYIRSIFAVDYICQYIDKYGFEALQAEHARLKGTQTTARIAT